MPRHHRPTCYYTAHNIIAVVRATGDRCNTAARSLFFCLWLNFYNFFIHSQHMITSSYTTLCLPWRTPGPDTDAMVTRTTGRLHPPDEDSRPPAAAAIARRTGIRCPLPLSTSGRRAVRGCVERSISSYTAVHCRCLPWRIPGPDTDVMVTRMTRRLRPRG